MSRFSLAPRVRYLLARARRIDVASVIERAKEASSQHGKAVSYTHLTLPTKRIV